ncbi:MAG: exodeoxyribonuclease VII large subunit, partial [Halomonas sp.]
TLRARLRHPGEQLNHQRQHLTTLTQRLQRAMQQTLTQQKAQVTQLEKRLAGQDMARLYHAEQERLNNLQRRLASAMQRAVEARQVRLNSTARELNAVSPLAVLGRGYAIAQDEKGHIIRRADDTAPGQKLSLRLGEGKLSVEVKRRYKK